MSCFNIHSAAYFRHLIYLQYLGFAVLLYIPAGIVYLQPGDMPDPDDFDEDDTLEEGLTELDRRRHVSKEEDLDLIEDEDDSFVDELDEEE